MACSNIIDGMQSGLQLLAITVLLGTMATSALSQTSSKAYKLDEFDVRKDDPVVFAEKAKTFLTILGNGEPTTTGYVTLYTNDPLAKVFFSLGKASLLDRVNLLQPGRRMQEEIGETVQFWIVPANAEAPFHVVCAMCDCPSLSVDGKNQLELSDSDLVFKANVSGSATVLTPGKSRAER